MTETLNLTKNNINAADDILQIAIIGAGLTGLMTAHLLEQNFSLPGRALKITLFEKSSGVGRLATRYKKPDSISEANKQWQFDFGAQFFTAKSDLFQSYLQPWLDQGIIQPWYARTARLISDSSEPEIQLTGKWDSNQPRYIGSPKMTSFGRILAAKLTHSEICYKTHVAPLIKKQAEVMDSTCKTNLLDIDGNHLGSFDWVVCTAPQQQAIDLMKQTDFEALDSIKKPRMQACYALMLGWEDLSQLPARLKQSQWEVLEAEDEKAAIGRVFIEHLKPGRELILPSVTIHAGNAWSETQVDEDLEQVKNQLLQEAKHLLGWDQNTAPKWVDCHRWRYAALKPLSTPSLNGNSGQIAHIDSSKQWIVTGDWCDEGRIESCFKAAKQVVKAVGDRHL